MKIRKTSLILLSIVLLMSNHCTPKNEKSDEKVINIEKGLNNFAIIPLSEYASGLRYVKLESFDENSLLTEGIKNIFLEDGKLFVHDEEPFLKVFDAGTGEYLYNIGAKGQGPGELPFLPVVDMNPHFKKIMLNYSEISNEFDFQGNFIGRIQIPDIGSTQRIYQNVVLLKDNLFASGVRTYTRTQEDAVIVFDRNGKIINTLKSYKDPIQHPNSTMIVWGPFEQGGVFYRYKDDVRYYRSISDTIYSFEKSENKFKPFLSLYFGRHDSNHNYNPDSENPEVIILRSAITENPDAIFIDLYMKNSSPEPFEDKIWRGGHFRDFINKDVLGIYDKERNELFYLLQPIPGIRGLKNDLDNGIPFWPKYISSTGEMVDFHHAYKFIEYAEKLFAPKPAFKEMLDCISEEDNPIIIIASP